MKIISLNTHIIIVSVEYENYTRTYMHIYILVYTRAYMYIYIYVIYIINIIIYIYI